MIEATLPPTMDEPTTDEAGTERRPFGRRPLGLHRPNAEPRVVKPLELSDPVVKETAIGSLIAAFACAFPATLRSKDRIRTHLGRAGCHQPQAFRNLMAVRYAGLMLSIVVFGTLLVIVPATFEPWCVAGLVVSMIGTTSLPLIALRRQAACRLAEIERGLPEFFELLSLCVGKRMPLRVALSNVGRALRTNDPALADELAIVCRQAEMGNIDQALENFARRIDLPDVRTLVSLLGQNTRGKSDVAAAIRASSDAIRQSQAQSADRDVNRAALRLLLPAIFCSVAALYLLLVGPSVVEITQPVDSGQQQVSESSDSLSEP